jgi:hypothetical protein
MKTIRSTYFDKYKYTLSQQYSIRLCSLIHHNKNTFKQKGKGLNEQFFYRNSSSLEIETFDYLFTSVICSFCPIADCRSENQHIVYRIASTR